MRVLPNIDLASGRAAYEHQDAAQFATVAAALGIDLSLRMVTELVRPFERSYRASIVETVLKQLYAATLDPIGYGFEQWAARITCLAVRIADRVVLGVQQSYPNKPFPQDGWPIKRWYTDAARNVTTVHAWAADPARTADAITIAITSVAAPARETRTGGDLLAAVVANPRDDAARLVYADWLLEQGDVRGELIRLQCELDVAGVRDPRRVEMRNRERVLLRDHRAAIVRDLAGITEALVIKRGLVEHVTIRAQALAKHGASMVASHPIHRMRILVDSPAALAKLGTLDYLARVPAIEIVARAKPKQPSPCAIGPSSLVGCPAFADIEELVLTDVSDGDDEWAQFFASFVAPRLTSLAIDHGRIGPNARELLAHARTLPALRRLRIGRTSGNCEEAGSVLSRIAARPQLDTLVLAFDQLHWDAAQMDRVMCEVLAHASSLTELHLEPYTAGGDRSLAAIAASPSALTLQRLVLHRGHFTTAALATLIRALPNLRELTLDPYPSDVDDLDPLVVAFLASPTLKQVRWDRCTLGPIRTQRVLAHLDLVEADPQTGRLWLSTGSKK